MKHPEVLLVPVLMLLDYFLTIAGVVLGEKGYAKHIKMEHYELNPFWQKHVGQKKWFNPRHLLLTALLSSLLFMVMEFGSFEYEFDTFVLGLVLVFYGGVIGQHVSSLLIFRSVVRRPGEISGQIEIKHSLMLYWSMYRYLAILFPLMLIAVLSPTPFVLGGLTGALWLLVMIWTWIRKYRKKLRAAAQLSSTKES